MVSLFDDGSYYFAEFELRDSAINQTLVQYVFRTAQRDGSLDQAPYTVTEGYTKLTPHSHLEIRSYSNDARLTVIDSRAQPTVRLRLSLDGYFIWESDVTIDPQVPDFDFSGRWQQVP
jgi:hypothetical protein